MALTALVLLSCGPADLGKSPITVPTPETDPSETASAPVIAETENPFAGLTTGDDFEWGYFIKKDSPFVTTRVDSLPIPVYPVFFSEEELQTIQEGIALANNAVGFEVFELVDEWTSDARPIYKVSRIDFGTENAQGFLTVGYTYSRNVYPEGKYDAARVVTDWAMEVMDGHLTKWVIAHELGHAMGIQKHALIDYDHDTVEALESSDLMNAVIPANPSLNEYTSMMQMQGDILLRNKNRF